MDNIARAIQYPLPDDGPWITRLLTAYLKEIRHMENDRAQKEPTKVP